MLLHNQKVIEMFIFNWLWIRFWTEGCNTLRNYSDNASNDPLSDVKLHKPSTNVYHEWNPLSGQYHIQSQTFQALFDNAINFWKAFTLPFFSASKIWEVFMSHHVYIYKSLYTVEPQEKAVLK